MRLLSILMLTALALAGCGSEPTPCEIAFWHDADDDGFGGRQEVWIGCEAPPRFVAGPADCDDDDPDIFPGADEHCDGVDDDCNGAIDDEPVDPPRIYLDADGDRFGTPDEWRYGCVTWLWSLNDDDCDDSDGDVFPGNEETCDALDRDCDGDPYLNAVDGEVWFLDIDQDGYGRVNNPKSGCGEPYPGYALNSDDCADNNASIHPGAVEGLLDGVDQDCDGTELCPYDVDGDGYAGQATAIADLACSLLGATTVLGDCDDSDASISPDGIEIPYNGIDEDCNPVTRDDDLDEDGWLAADECDDWDPQSSPDSDPRPLFEDIAGAVGISELQWDPGSSPPLCAGMVEWMSGGAAVSDYDGDGRHDIFLSRMYAPDLLYHQLPSGTFEEVGAAAGVDWPGSSNGAVWFDADADGDLDLYVVMVGTETNRLYIQDAGAFTEEAALRGAQIPLTDPTACAQHWSVSATDADADADLDLHVTAWQMPDFAGTDRGRLLLNDGAGFFTDGTVAAGLDFSARAGFTSAFVDTDGDGDRDLALAGDFGTSGLFRNDGGVYTEITGAAMVGTDENGMGADWGDVDGDGDLDWFVTSVYDDFTIPCNLSWGCTGNRLFVNEGGNLFSDGTDAAGLRDGAWGWGAAMVDIDHDGDLDIAQQNGMPHAGFTQDAFRMWVNDGTGAFSDESCHRLTEHPGQGRAVVPFDADDDGDLDLLITFTADRPMLLENQGGAESGHWLRVSLSDPTGLNRFGVGSVVRATPAAGGSTWVRRVDANSTFTAVGPAEAHFGFGIVDTVDLEITWPDGGVQLVPGVVADQHLTVVRI